MDNIRKTDQRENKAQLAEHVTTADEDPVDPKKFLEDRCKGACLRPWRELQKCNKRIEGDESGQKHCTGQYFDYWSCVDKCVAEKLFAKLK